MKVAVYLFILFTVLLSCVEAQFKKDVMRSLLSPRQSTSDCDDILPGMCTKPIQEKLNATNINDIQDIARTLSDSCEDCETYCEYILGLLCSFFCSL